MVKLWQRWICHWYCYFGKWKREGPWKHQPERLFEKDGGHGMIFKTFDGQLVIPLHQPNTSPNERMHFYKLKDLGESLKLDGELF